MNPLELTSLVTFLANFIACNVCDNSNLVLLASIFNQLGDTLSTIALQKAQCDSSSTLFKKHH